MKNAVAHGDLRGFSCSEKIFESIYMALEQIVVINQSEVFVREITTDGEQIDSLEASGQLGEGSVHGQLLILSIHMHLGLYGDQPGSIDPGQIKAFHSNVLQHLGIVALVVGK